MVNKVIEQCKQDIIVAFNRYLVSYNSKEITPLYSKVGELLRNRISYQFFVNEDQLPIIVIGKGLYLTYDINVKSIVATIEYFEGNKVTPIINFIYTYKFSALVE